MEGTAPGSWTEAVGEVDGRIHFKTKQGVCVGGAILCDEVAELIVLKGPFVLGSYDSLC